MLTGCCASAAVSVYSTEALDSVREQLYRIRCPCGCAAATLLEYMAAVRHTKCSVAAQAASACST